MARSEIQTGVAYWIRPIGDWPEGEGYCGNDTPPTNGDPICCEERRTLILVPADEDIRCAEGWIAELVTPEVGQVESDGTTTAVAVYHIGGQGGLEEWEWAVVC